MIELIQPEERNFVKYCLLNGAKVTDLIIPTQDPLWPGLCNPSIYNDNGQLKLVLRNVNYVMHSSADLNHNWTDWGPLQYMIPEEDWVGLHLRTRNYMCDVDEDNGITKYHLVNTTKYDKKPKWEFVGHEDARLVRWNEKMYMTGVRRDDNTTGVGRMSLCTIDNKYNEIARKKLDNPSFGYCEKNWMAIIDMPYCYVRNTYPVTEIIQVDPKTGSCKIIQSINQDISVSHDMMLRGSSQVIPWKNGKHIALVHTCNLWLNELDKKVSRYHFHFIVWDENWKIERISKLFTFNDFNIEFSNGLALKDGKFYIPFALQDNMAFLLAVNEGVVEDFIYDNPVKLNGFILPSTPIVQFFMNDKDPSVLSALGQEYYDRDFKAGAYCLFQRAVDFDTNPESVYINTFMMARSLADLGHRDPCELEMWWKLIDLDPTKPEGYLAVANYYLYRKIYNMAYHFAQLAYLNVNNASFYYDTNQYFETFMISQMFTEHREDAISWIQEHESEYPNLYETMRNIAVSQFQVRRIL